MRKWTTDRNVLKYDTTCLNFYDSNQLLYICHMGDEIHLSKIICHGKKLLSYIVFREHLHVEKI